MTTKRRIAVALVLLSIGAWFYAAWWMLEHKSRARRAVVLTFEMLTLDGFGPEPGAARMEGADLKRKQIPIRLEKVAEGFQLPTDIQFLPPGQDGKQRSVMLVAQKVGSCAWVDLDRGTRGVLFEVDVEDEGEMGLLGLAFHPRFADNQLLYVHYDVRRDSKWYSRITEWRVQLNAAHDLQSASEQRVLLEVEQPYSNHKGGQLAFGPDGYLYIGLGDGGFIGDPQRNGQNLGSLLGKLLRVDVDHRGEHSAYAIPADNPFVGQAHARAEIWAYGLRNPWRYSFDRRGRLITGDVGQERWEELNFVTRGDNFGWNVREGRECFVSPLAVRTNEDKLATHDACDHAGMIEPLYVYGHEEGTAIIGGMEQLASDIAALRGKYVFADCLRGRFWALDLPAATDATLAASDAYALGGFHVIVSSFGRDPKGRLYIADLGTELYSGVIYRLAAP